MVIKSVCRHYMESTTNSILQYAIFLTKNYFFPLVALGHCLFYLVPMRGNSSVTQPMILCYFENTPATSFINSNQRRSFYFYRVLFVAFAAVQKHCGYYINRSVADYTSTTVLLWCDAGSLCK